MKPELRKYLISGIGNVSILCTTYQEGRFKSDTITQYIYNGWI